MLMPWLSLKLSGEEKYLQAPVVDPENVQETALFSLQSLNHPKNPVPALLPQPQSPVLSQPWPGHCLGSGASWCFAISCGSGVIQLCFQRPQQTQLV